MLRLLMLLIVAVVMSSLSCGADPATPGEANNNAAVPSVDPQLMSQLEFQLAAVLDAQGGKGMADVDGDYVDCTWSRSGPDTDVKWFYYNPGDYDQNSEVNASDLVPIALYFGNTSTGGQWANAQISDGDENGEVNFSDVTPIGVNFGSKVLAYTIEGFSKIDQTWHLLDTQPFSAGYDDFARRYYTYYTFDHLEVYTDFRVRTIGE